MSAPDFSEVQVFTGELTPKQQDSPTIMTEATVQREIAEVQASIAIAKRFPRNQAQALDRIQIACQRPGLAESALYSYARGGTEITGPSIRLAEAIAQQWGNLDFGIREIEQRNGESTVEAYAWDLETNTRQKKTFQVRHKRFTKKGSYDLTDPRDIYELVANQGARRLRACILGVIPGDVVEAAQTQCEQTLKAKADISPEAVKKMVTAFEAFKVSKEQIETRIQRKLESITAAQVIALRKIYNSLKDGMSAPADWFELTEPQPEKKQISSVNPLPEYHNPIAEQQEGPAQPSFNDLLADYPGDESMISEYLEAAAAHNKVSVEEIKEQAAAKWDAFVSTFEKWAKKNAAKKAAQIAASAPPVADKPKPDTLPGIKKTDTAMQQSQNIVQAITDEQIDRIEELCRVKQMPLKDALVAEGLLSELIELDFESAAGLIEKLAAL